MHYSHRGHVCAIWLAAQSASITVDPFGAPRAAKGMCATTHDLARVGQLLFEGERIAKSCRNHGSTGSPTMLIRRPGRRETSPATGRACRSISWRSGRSSEARSCSASGFTGRTFRRPRECDRDRHVFFSAAALHVASIALTGALVSALRKMLAAI